MAQPAIQGQTKRSGLTTVAGWAFIFAVMLAVWGAPPLTGTFPDTDDYMRLERVFALLDGEGLPSYAAPGLGIDGQAEIGWSRLIDMPLAALQGGLELFMARQTAALWSATIMPALALLAFLAAAFWYARPLTGGRPVYTLLAVLLLWALLRQFMPGRVDHHMWQAVLAVLAYGALIRCYLTPQRTLFPALAGGAFATGLAVGADILPGLTFGTALLGLFWLGRGGAFEKAALVFGSAVFGGTLLFHLLLFDPGRFWLPFCDSLSVVWLALTAAIFLFWALIRGLPATFKAGRAGRFFSGLAVFVPLMAALYLLFPSCFHDLYQIENPVVRRIWLDAVNEAQPLLPFWAAKPAAALFFIVPPVLALAGALWAIRAEKERALLWAGLALVLLFALALSFYQIRTADFAQAVAVAPLGWLLLTLREWLAALLGRLALTRGQRLAAASLFFLLALGFFAFSLVKKDKADQQEAAAQAAQCDLRQAAAVLNDLPGSLTIAAHIDAGSELLFRTGHKVLAAPYHRNQAGILAVYDIFTSSNEAQALQAARRSGADLLMLCARQENYWTTLKKAQPVFAGRLLADDTPYWLRPLGTAEKNGGYLILKRVE